LRFRLRILWAAVGAAGLWIGHANAAADSGIDFFEQHVRPVLVENCYKCHSAQAEKVKGGLLLDTRDGLLKGGDTGPAIVPGDPDKSLLIKAIRYTDENLQMPPKNKKLAADKIEALEHWVKMGAPDPRTSTNAIASKTEAAKKHWAFQPVRMPAVPAVKHPELVESPIDNFVLAKLEAKGLTFSPAADRRTLIRRATYDLTGLPPSAEDVEAFAADRSPDAFGRVVDRLLASPRYGERWARYWLDIARYADTKGYVFEEERRYAFAYTYRDYVIRALNEDLPYDQFIEQQLAADSLPLGNDKRPLAALGFLTLGRRFLNNQPDIIDDRLDVVGRGLMGLTIACARCHDHKFDPIPTKDYYSLYGVFASCDEPADKPLLGTNSLPKQYPEYLAEKQKREAELKKFLSEKEGEVTAKLHGQVGEYLLVAHETALPENKGKQEAIAREHKLSPTVAEHWSAKLAKATAADPIFGAWIQFASLPQTNFAEGAKSVTASIAAGKSKSNACNTIIAGFFTNAPGSLKEAAARYSAAFAEVDKKWRAITAGTNSSPPAALPNANAEALRQVLYADGSPFALAPDQLHRLFDTPAQQKQRALRRKIEELDATHPGAPQRAMVLVDKATPVEPVVFVRGNAANAGPKVPRQFLEVLSTGHREPFKQGSGRLELARDIASTNNPLTARVFVNRAWMYHFGAPLVRTPSDFGTRSDPPINPELLDYLASHFMADGWSIKKLHRLMMLSRTYQQASDDDAARAKADPGNDLLGRMNRRRLDFEAMRDSLLVAAGRLDLTMGGLSSDITTQPFSTRRSVYAFIERQNLPGIFRTFDFASPDTSSAQRYSTTVPQQALFLMNSPFVVEQARHFVERVGKSATNDAVRIGALYRVAFQRAPQPDELELARSFIRAQATETNEPPPPSAWQYGFGAYNAQSNRVTSFTALPHFTGSSWQGGPKLPDDKLGWVLLNADGGHVGNDLQHAAIRRWTAPADGAISIDAWLAHGSAEGDGVRGRIVSSRTGPLGEWVVHNSKATTNVERVEVKRGDTIDFVADMRTNYGYDSFSWSPVIRYRAGYAGPAGGTWKAKENFAGPAPKTEPLTPWEKYAQVLLLANEFMFVD